MTFSFSSILPRQEQRDGRRHEGQRQHQRREQRDDDGERHRPEHFSFDAGEREDRQVDQNHHQHADEARREHLARRGEDRVQALLEVQQPPDVMLPLAPAAGCSSRR